MPRLDSIMPTRRTATTTLNIGNYFRIAPDQSPDLRRPRPVRAVEPDLRSQIRPHPGSHAASHLPAAWPGRHRLLLGRDHRSDGRIGCRGRESMKACSTPWGIAAMAPRCRFTWDRKWPPLWPVMRRPIRCAACPGPRCLVISGRHGSCRSWARTTGSRIWSAKHRPFAKLRPKSPAPPRADPLSSPTAQETESRSAPHRI